MKRSQKRNAAFTLLEIMMVVMIIALLAGAAIFSMKDSVTDAGKVRVASDLSMFKTQLLMYRAQNGFYPTTQQGLKALMTKPDTQPIPKQWSQRLKEMPVDSWQNEYFYECPGKRSGDDYDIYSAGPNRQPGDADDIGNWKNES